MNNHTTIKTTDSTTTHQTLHNTNDTIREQIATLIAKLNGTPPNPKDDGKQTKPTQTKPTAVIFRLVKGEQICPFGLKALHLLKSRYHVIDCPIKNDDEASLVKDTLNVKTTPQIFINNQPIGGYDDLSVFLGKRSPNPNKKSYRPIIAVLVSTFLMAIALAMAMGVLFSVQPLLWFVAFSMCVLAIKKLENLDSFSNGFLGYDLLARKWVPYAYIYPFIELLSGLTMLSHHPLAMAIGGLLAMVIGAIGAVSVIKAVYLDKRNLSCACVGGNSKVPLGFISLMENIAMLIMGGYMLWAFI